jgi:hypothetical protein
MLTGNTSQYVVCYTRNFDAFLSSELFESKLQVKGNSDNIRNTDRAGDDDDGYKLCEPFVISTYLVFRNV